MGFTHYYKMKVYVDDGMVRYETWKYVIANSEDAAMKSIFRHYDLQGDYVRVLEMYLCPLQDKMIFDNLIITSE